MAEAKDDDRLLGPDVLGHLEQVAREVGRVQRIKVEDELCNRAQIDQREAKTLSKRKTRTHLGQ